MPVEQRVLRRLLAPAGDWQEGCNAACLTQAKSAKVFPPLLWRWPDAKSTKSLWLSAMPTRSIIARKQRKRLAITMYPSFHLRRQPFPSGAIQTCIITWQARESISGFNLSDDVLTGIVTVVEGKARLGSDGSSMDIITLEARYTNQENVEIYRHARPL